MAKDPRSMTSRGRPGSGSASGAARSKQTVITAKKKTKQATGAAPAGYMSKKPPVKVQKVNKRAVTGSHKKRGDSGAGGVPGKTNYKY